MAKITLDSIVSGFGSTTKFNSNFDAIEAEFQNKVLYRDNPTGEPNQMETNLDMNSLDILNAGVVEATSLTIGGTSVSPSDIAADVAGSTHTATSKATPVDADELPLVDSVVSYTLKKLTWANLKATLKTYFDTIYQASLGYTPRNAADDVTLVATKVIIFEGTTDDTFETTLSVTDPTADNILSLPNKSGTLAVTSDIPTGLDIKVNDFRLTLTSGTPVTTADVTGATTIYCTPFTGNQIALYDGVGTWNIRNSSEFSLALGTLTANLPYDVFCYDNSGTPTLEFTAWTNDSTRTTALIYQDGILVKTGATSRRYLGSFYTTSTTQTEDSQANRYLYNHYNGVIRNLYKTDATASWTYTLASWRQANGSTTNQVNALIGWVGNVVQITTRGAAKGTGNVDAAVGIGYDSTSANSGISNGGGADSAYYSGLASELIHYPTVGKHYWAWLEIAQASGTVTWVGSTTSNGVPITTGIFGHLVA